MTDKGEDGTEKKKKRKEKSERSYRSQGQSLLIGKCRLGFNQRHSEQSDAHISSVHTDHSQSEHRCCLTNQISRWDRTRNCDQHRAASGLNKWPDESDFSRNDADWIQTWVNKEQNCWERDSWQNKSKFREKEIIRKKVKGIVQTNMNLLSSFTQRHVRSNLLSGDASHNVHAALSQSEAVLTVSHTEHHETWNIVQNCIYEEFLFFLEPDRRGH